MCPWLARAWPRIYIKYLSRTAEKPARTPFLFFSGFQVSHVPPVSNRAFLSYPLARLST